METQAPVEVTSNDLELVAKAMSRPSGWVKYRLGVKLHPKQAAVLDDLFPEPSKRKTSRVSFRCGNEVGKTASVAAPAILFAIEVLNAQVISTAGVWMQVAQQLIPHLKSYAHLFPDWQFLDSTIKVNGLDRYVGFSTRDEGFAQGFHKRAGMPLVAIIDEAAAVTPGVFAGVEDRCNPDYMLIMGSPLDPTGNFYDIETKLHKFYTHHHLPQTECLTTDGWWIDPSSVERKINKYGGKEHPFVMSNIFGEFSHKVDNALLSLAEFNACIENPPEFHQGHNNRHAFIDVAGGVAKNVFAVRHGNKVWVEKKWVESSEMATIGEIIAIANKLNRSIGLEHCEISIDASGAGKPMADRLREMGYNLHRFTGQSKTVHDHEYANAISEVWGSGAAKIRGRDIIIPNDDDFRSQILTRTLKRNSKGKFQIESKEDMVRRGVSSPDEADAILGAIMPAYIQAWGNNQEQEWDRSWMERGYESEGRTGILPAEACL